MKFLTLLVLASLGTALPIYEGSSPAQTQSQTALSTSNEKSSLMAAHQWIMLGKPGFKDSPTFQEYVERHRDELAFIRSNEKEFNIAGLSSSSRPNIGSQPGPLSNAHRPKKTTPYGVYLGKLIPFKSGAPCKSNTTHTAAYTKHLDFLDIMENYGPECVGLAIFVLVPIAYFVLELLELAFKYFVRERFPERGRSPVRLSGPERQIRALNDLEREMVVESEKQWWHTRRARG